MFWTFVYLDSLMGYEKVTKRLQPKIDPMTILNKPKKFKSHCILISKLSNMAELVHTKSHNPQT